jgi:hypothetical protein
MQNLKRQLKKLRTQSAAPKAFKLALQKQLKEELDEVYPYMPAHSRTYRMALATTLIVVLALTTGTGVYAYESPGVTEGHALHPIKDAVEHVEGMLAFSPEKQVRYHAKMMDRRLKEAEHFMANPEEIHRALIRVADELGVTVEELITMPPKPEMYEQVMETLRTQNTRFESVIAQLEENQPENLPELDDVFTQVRTRMQKAGVSEEQMGQFFQQKHQKLRNHLLHVPGGPGLDKIEEIE